MISAIIRLVVHLPIMLITSVANTVTSSASSNSQRGIRGKLFGWPPSRLEPARDTAWLDGVRGVAAFLVMAHHFNIGFLGLWVHAPYGSTLLPQNELAYDFWRLPFIRAFLVAGNMQVGVFFVLSGMVLSWKPLDLIRHGQVGTLMDSISSSVVRRWFRLYLPCFGAVLLSWAVYRYEGNVPPGTPEYPSILRQLWDYVVACEEFARPLRRDRKYPDWLHRYNWTVWTIPLEFEGSLLVFLSLVAMARIKTYASRLVILATVCLYSCVLGYWTYWLFAAGVLMADHVKESGGFHRLSQTTTPTSRTIWWLVLMLGFWIGTLPVPNPKFYNRPGFEFLDWFTPAVYLEMEGGARFWYSIGGILVMLASCHLRRVQIICESTPAQYMGRISYMLYVTHDDAPKKAGLAFRSWYGEIWGTKVWSDLFERDIYKYTWLTGTILYFLSWTISGCFAIVLAHWCDVLIDQPSVAFAKRLEMRLTGEGNSGDNSSSNITNERHGSDGDVLVHESIPLPIYRSSSSND